MPGIDLSKAPLEEKLMKNHCESDLVRIISSYKIHIQCSSMTKFWYNLYGIIPHGKREKRLSSSEKHLIGRAVLARIPSKF